ncbi:SDR family oxidoreductase [Streptomyces californicus]|uniref:SDR family oxidoreductase n=1 Tax=Streptomyces californicus TaxID=67351 RepID=UPI0036A45586
MMVVTGATGNIGRELVRQLHTEGRGSGVRALTRDAARARAVLPAGVDLAEGDLGRADSLKSALDGARSLFLIAGVGDDAGILDVARDAGVEHVVLVSSITTVTHPHLGPARANLAVERRLRESGMAWTVLRPTQFASNTLWWAEAVREESAVRVPYPDIGLPAVHPADIASVARAGRGGAGPPRGGGPPPPSAVSHMRGMYVIRPSRGCRRRRPAPGSRPARRRRGGGSGA